MQSLSGEVSDEVSSSQIEWNGIFVQDHGITAHEKIEIYNKNAHTYDSSMSEEEYNGPRQLAEVVHHYFQNRLDASILCVPAGTGTEIAELQMLGNYTNITALDASSSMLDILKQKGICSGYICKFFHKDCGLPHDTYDAVISVGGFVPKHLQCDALEEMCDIVKPGGLVIVMCREAYLYESVDYNNGKFFSVLDSLEQAGRWRKITRDVVQNYFGCLTGSRFVYQKV